MTIQHSHALRLAFAAAIVFAALLLLPRSAAFAAAATAVYRGDVPAASGPGRRIELRLSADGTFSWLTDYRNNRAPVIEEGHWNPITVEEVEVVIERRDGKPVTPSRLRFVKQGDWLRTTPESAAQFGSKGLEFKLTKAATPAVAVPVLGAASPIGSWKWEGLVAATDRITVGQPERYTLELQPGGKATVRADCNRGQASYKLDGRGIGIKFGNMTKATCPAGSLSARYLKALEAAVSQRVRGDNLFLDLPGEGGTLKFIRGK